MVSDSMGAFGRRLDAEIAERVTTGSSSVETGKTNSAGLIFWGRGLCVLVFILIRAYNS